MDKSFFSFDIDDEIVKMSEIEKSEKLSTKKINQEFDFNSIFASKKLKTAQSSNFVKNEGLAEKKKINSNLSKVNDYTDFDFRARYNSIEFSGCELINDQMQIILSNEEVNSVITKSQIGVMFF